MIDNKENQKLDIVDGNEIKMDLNNPENETIKIETIDEPKPTSIVDSESNPNSFKAANQDNSNKSVLNNKNDLSEDKPIFEDNKAYEEFSSKHYTNDELNNIARYQSVIVFEFSLLVGTSPSSSEAHALVDRWKDFITKYFYTCTDSILNGLSDVYINDLRFKNNLDLYKPNTAEFMSSAIKEYLK